MPLIYKICSAASWRTAEETGVFTGAPIDEADGFIHLSTAGQVEETAARHFAGQADLVLAAIDSDRLGEALRYEPSRGGALFPHLYGPLPISAVPWSQPLPLGPDGRHVFPDLARLASASDPGAVFDPGAAGWTAYARGAFAELVGPLWFKDVDGERHFGFVAESRHLNLNGIVHGGMLMTFADQVLGMTSSRLKVGRQATVQLDTHFLSSARIGDFVEARTRITRRTRSILFMAAEVFVGDRPVATAMGVWKILGA